MNGKITFTVLCLDKKGRKTDFKGAHKIRVAVKEKDVKKLRALGKIQKLILYRDILSQIMEFAESEGTPISADVFPGIVGTDEIFNEFFGIE